MLSAPWGETMPEPILSGRGAIGPSSRRSGSPALAPSVLLVGELEIRNCALEWLIGDHERSSRPNCEARIL